MRSGSMLVWIGTAFLGLVMGGIAACSGTGDGSGGCVAGEQKACACPGGVMSVQVCSADGKGLEPCQCGGAGGSGSTSSASGGQMGACGDGIAQPGECDTHSEFYCAKDCPASSSTSGSSSSGGDPCLGHVYYAAMAVNVPSVWVSGGLTSVPAGDDMCQKLNMGADHVCDYTEVLAAEKNGELKAIPMGTTAWMERTTPAISMIDGKVSAPGPGGRCNDWTYGTNHRSNGEYISFDALGVPTYHIDNDTVYDPNDATHVYPTDMKCGGVNHNILCCYTKCK